MSYNLVSQRDIQSSNVHLLSVTQGPSAVTGILGSRTLGEACGSLPAAWRAFSACPSTADPQTTPPSPPKRASDPWLHWTQLPRELPLELLLSYLHDPLQRRSHLPRRGPHLGSGSRQGEQGCLRQRNVTRHPRCRRRGRERFPTSERRRRRR